MMIGIFYYRVLSLWRNVALRFKRKIRLPDDTIVVNKFSWRFFDSGKFTSNYHICETPLDLISKKDYCRIVAYIGSIDKRKLPLLSRLRWLQIPSHGTNGFDDKNLYTNKNVIVSRAANIFSEPISQYCIAAYYFLIHLVSGT